MRGTSRPDSAVMAERGLGPCGLTSFALLGAMLAPVAHAEPSPERQATLLHRLKHDCGSCHGMTLKGGLGPPLVPQAIRERREADLVEVILHGIPGTPMPPWEFELTAEEARWLVRRLQAGIDDAG